jgi:hypothetical protein
MRPGRLDAIVHPIEAPMPIFGYSKGIINEYGLHEMSEVSFDLPLADLRRIACFLNDCADRAEIGDWRSSHCHLIDFDRDWDNDHPEVDLIVIHPAPDPPRRVG